MAKERYKSIITTRVMTIITAAMMMTTMKLHANGHIYRLFSNCVFIGPPQYASSISLA
jgi:hypothetical protein